MPFTPFHYGPGLLIKGLLPRHFSLTTFVATQVPIDCEPFYYMIRNEYPVHRELHTLIGATLLGAAAATVTARARPVIQDLLKSQGPPILIPSETADSSEDCPIHCSMA